MNVERKNSILFLTNSHVIVFLWILSELSIVTVRAFSSSGLATNLKHSNNSVVKHMFMSTMKSESSSSQKSIAIIGGGISGLSAAQHLQLHSNWNITVFDTGRLRVGGRCSSRLQNDIEKNEKTNKDAVLTKCIYDHAAQIITVPKNTPTQNFDSFRRQVETWRNECILKPFPEGSLVEVDYCKTDTSTSHEEHDSKRTIITRPVSSHDKFYPVHGMGHIPLAMLSPNVKYHQDTWISPGNGVKFIGNPSKPQWTIQSNGQRYGTFDEIIIAHNGKCADRLMSKTPAKDVHRLLEVDFRPTVPEWGGKKMTLNSIYSLTFVLKGNDGAKIDDVVGKDTLGAFLCNAPDVKFLAMQSKKYPVPELPNYQVFTLLSSPKFAKKYKGPQENLPQDTIEKVTHLMTTALEESLGLKKGSIEDSIFESRLQLWGAAVPLNVWKSKALDDFHGGFIYDHDYGVGVCGDWLLDPSIAGAWESGRRLAWWISENKGTVGLTGTFKASKSVATSGIGNLK
jgi:predicted NAD/FAD-dependent oxidoreductase